MNWDDLSHLPFDEVLVWAGSQPWARAMADCQQDAAWHAEGDVWTHTQLVCHQLPRLEEWSELDPQEQTILFFTALFHDAGKPLTSRLDPVTGRITSPHHAAKGEQLCRQVLRGLACDLATRETIARLVRYHGRPAFLLEKAHPEHEVVGLSWRVSNRLLYLFALADSRGRHATDSGRPEENLHYLKLIAEENDCFDRPYPFPNDQARFQFFRQSEPNLFYVPHEKYRSSVTMMSGLPGSGKDTWLATCRPDLAMVSLDGIRGDLEIDATENQGAVIQAARERCRELLRVRTPFAFNATNLLHRTRQRWIDLFADYEARIDVIYLEPPMSVILSQNKRRPEPVPENVIRDLVEIVEPPTWAEAHGITLVE